MKTKWKLVLGAIPFTMVALFFWCVIGSSSNLDWVKDRAVEKWKSQGFIVVDYEGFKWGFGGWGTRFGGAQVWYRLKKTNPSSDWDKSRYYSGFLQRWGEEVHVYDGSSIGL